MVKFVSAESVGEDGGGHIYVVELLLVEGWNPRIEGILEKECSPFRSVGENKVYSFRAESSGSGISIGHHRRYGGSLEIVCKRVDG